MKLIWGYVLFELCGSGVNNAVHALSWYWQLWHEENVEKIVKIFLLWTFMMKVVIGIN
jgi:hypothetical protein